MKRANREIEIFSVSALDLFASAMGAFILIALILFPYYTNTSKEDMENRKKELQGKLAACQAEGGRLERVIETKQKQNREAETELKNCEELSVKTYLAVVIQWSTRRHDIDLHLTDPRGNEFSYRLRRIRGVNGELSADTKNGPGIEIWETPIALVGEYKIQYDFFAKHGNPKSTKVKGAVYYRNGTLKINDVTLSQEKERPARLATTIIVKPNGDVELR